MARSRSGLGAGVGSPTRLGPVRVHRRKELLLAQCLWVREESGAVQAAPLPIDWALHSSFWVPTDASSFCVES